MSRQPRWIKRQRVLLSVANRQAQTGDPGHAGRSVVHRKEYRVTKAGVRRTRVVEYGPVVADGSVRQDPGVSFSWQLRGRLRAAMRPTAPVTLYDAEGRVIGTMDPLTRQRTMLDTPAAAVAQSG